MAGRASAAASPAAEEARSAEDDPDPRPPPSLEERASATTVLMTDPTACAGKGAWKPPLGTIGIVVGNFCVVGASVRRPGRKPLLDRDLDASGGEEPGEGEVGCIAAVNVRCA